MIKKAFKKGDTHLARMIFDASNDVAYSLTAEEEIDKVLETLDFYINMDENRLSHKNIWVYRVKEESAGLIVAYSSNDIKKLDEPIIKYLATKDIDIQSFDTECFANEFYIDTVSVRPSFQRRGIAKNLFIFIEEEAKRLGFEKISLLVDSYNFRALKLYEKMGFVKDGILKVSGINFCRMIKKI